MNAQQLKNAILQEAIEGRMVPQDPNDELAYTMFQSPCVTEVLRHLVIARICQPLSKSDVTRGLSPFLSTQLNFLSDTNNLF